VEAEPLANQMRWKKRVALFLTLPAANIPVGLNFIPDTARGALAMRGQSFLDSLPLLGRQYTYLGLTCSLAIEIAISSH